MSNSRRVGIGAELRLNSTQWRAGFNQARADAENFTQSVGRSFGRVSEVMQQSSRGATNAGMGMLMLSHTITGADRGIHSMIRSLGPLAMSLGAGPGVTGLLLAASVAMEHFAGTFEKAFDRLGGAEAYQKLLADNQVAILRYSRARNQAMAEARQNAEGEAKIAADAEASEDRRRAKEEKELHFRQEKLELEGKLKEAGADSLDYAQKLIAVEAIQKQTAHEILDLEIRLYTERLRNNEGQKKAATDRLQALEKERQELELMPARNGVQELRFQSLPGLIKGAETSKNAVKARDEADRAALDAAQKKQSLQPGEDELRKDKMGKDAVQHAADQAMETILSVLDDAAEAAEETRKSIKERARREAAAAAIQQNYDQKIQDIEIDRLRAKGRKHQADKLQDARDREKMIQDDKFSPEQADEILRARRAARKGPRHIFGVHGAASNDGGFHGANHDGGMHSQAAGIDGTEYKGLPYFHKGGDAKQEQHLSKKRQQQAKADAEKGPGGEDTKLLREIAQNTKDSAKTPAEKHSGKRRAA